jgi:ABC-type Fe3+-hydroxamate transport system substrate-binding protein
MRVVSLVPSVTETLLSWGVEPVACTRFCEQPAIRHVGGTKDPDIAAIVELGPDLVVLCEEENRREDAMALAEAAVPTVTLSVDTVDDVHPLLQMLAVLVGADAAGVGAVQHLPHPGPLVTVFVPIWRRPWMSLSGSTYGSALLELLGFANVCADSDDRYPVVDLDDIAARGPAAVLAPSEPYPFSERHVAELRDVAPVELVDGKDLFWWGARTPQAIDRLGAALQHLHARPG